MKAKDIMTTGVESIPNDISARDAVDILIDRKISGLPVLDRDGNLVGVFTERHVLTYILPSYIQKVGKFVYHEETKALRKRFNDLKNVKVEQLMYTKIDKVEEDAALCEVARIMLIQNTRRLLVVNNFGKLVGIVSRCDVFQALAKEAEPI